jgi:hypothetical protein
MERRAEILRRVLSEELQEKLRHATDEEAYLCLLSAYNVARPPPPPKINLSALTDDELWGFTRFTSRYLVQIPALLGLPPTFQTRNRYRFTREEGFFLLCARLSSKSTLFQLHQLFGYRESHISEAVNWMISWINDNWGFLLEDFSSGHLTKERLQLFAEKIKNHKKGAPLGNVWGFLDCTIRPICRPCVWQRICYNGHKKFHALKYSAVKSPDGLIYHLFGPFEGRRNDNALLNESQLIPRCLEQAPDFCLYGDSAYPISSVLLSPFVKLNPTEDEKQWNICMSARRECVEWGFADIVRLWKHLDDIGSQQLLSRPLGLMYRVAVILTNMHICIYGCQTTVYFNCAPPRLEEYLRKNVS